MFIAVGRSSNSNVSRTWFEVLAVLVLWSGSPDEQSVHLHRAVVAGNAANSATSGHATTDAGDLFRLLDASTSTGAAAVEFTASATAKPNHANVGLG